MTVIETAEDLDLRAEAEPAVDWYHRNYPEAPPINPRVLVVFAAWQQLYNLHPRTGRSRKDGGFRRWGEGWCVRLQSGEVSTFDDGAMTRLVLAAHKWCCRVAVSAERGQLLQVAVFPRTPGATSFWERHPSLATLEEQARTGSWPLP